jgi:phosphoribosylformimino-5-aminoimidazole carboxamide ribotide isomerase
VNVIPAIDLKEGQCVRLLRGDFEQTTVYGDDPVEIARRFAGLRTTDLHVVDLDGARSGRQVNREIVQAIARETPLRIQLGGGIRDRETATQWLQAGIARCVIGSLAASDPDLVKSLLAQLGGERIVLALDVKLDARGEPLVMTHGWTQSSNTSVFEYIDDFHDAGLKHVLCTDVGRDGAMAGPNVELYLRILKRFPDLALQASGGVRDLRDLQTLRANGIPAAITGRALLEGRITAKEMAAFRRSA